MKKCFLFLLTLLICGYSFTQSTVYYQQDALGDVVALTNSAGDVVEKYAYDVFSKPTTKDGSGTVIPASAFGNRFMFTGREYVQEIKLYDYRNRMYSDSLGRFLQTDPVGLENREVNLYCYVFNRPTNYKDPLGLDPKLRITQVTGKPSLANFLGGVGEYGQPWLDTDGDFFYTSNSVTSINIVNSDFWNSNCNSLDQNNPGGQSAGQLDATLFASPGTYNVDITVSAVAAGTGEGGANVRVTTAQGELFRGGNSRKSSFSKAKRVIVKVTTKAPECSAWVGSYIPSVTVKRGWQSGSAVAAGRITLNSIKKE